VVIFQDYATDSRLPTLLVKTIGDSGSGGLIDDTKNSKACNCTGILDTIADKRKAILRAIRGKLHHGGRKLGRKLASISSVAGDTT
jgi:hypothetical protein